jgi:hypothetical protein
MKKILLGVLIVLLCQAPARAQNAEVVNAYNEMVENIYAGLWKLKNQYPELANLSRSAITQDKNGLKQISYAHKSSEQFAWGDDDDPYAYRFSLSTRKLQDAESGSAEWKFPLLGFKVVYDIQRSGPLTTIDPFLLVEMNVEDLHLLEQGVLPFRLEIATDKEAYAPRETLNLTVSLRNLGAQPFRVFDLNEQSLFCKIDDMTWGSEEPQDTAEKVLAPYGVLSKILRIRGISKPKDTRISCRYGVGFRGVLPFHSVKVTVKPAQ